MTLGSGAADEILGRVMLSFEGDRLPPAIADRLAARPAAGVTFFRAWNDGAPDDVRALADSVQAAAARRGRPGGTGVDRGRRTGRGGPLPLLVAADQEAGQLSALSATTPFAGNMALGAAGDPRLAERVGRAIGTESRAMGLNVVYAPVCDIATEPAHPALGIRAFGDDPVAAGVLAAAMVRGIQSAGVAATLKHFPGKGDVSTDTHHALAVVGHDRERFDSVELRPFRDGIAAGARLVMSGHVAAPGLTGNTATPATLSRDVMDRLLRRELGFDGVTISDALDMKALAQGSLQVLDVLAAIDAGIDLLLFHDTSQRDAIEAALVHAVGRGLVRRSVIDRTRRRTGALRRWIAGFEAPDPGGVGSVAHRALAAELARSSITLVRDHDRLLPLRLDRDARIATIMPVPADLTPADTSSTVAPGLAAALRAHHPHVAEHLVGQHPSDAEIGAAVAAARDADLLVVGTIGASLHGEQAALVGALDATGRPLVTVALRTPFDLAAYPDAGTHICSYGILGPTMTALADALFGRAPFTGHLPAAIPGLYPTGHGLAPR